MIALVIGYVFYKFVLVIHLGNNFIQMGLAPLGREITVKGAVEQSGKDLVYALS
jgi:hypothetical protein